MTDYLRTSYELKLTAAWFSRNDLFASGEPYTAQNPLLVMQTVQVDLDQDGLVDLFTFDSYSLDAPTPNPPPSVFLNRQGTLEKVAWSGPDLGNPHGVKILVGDFNGDGLPDLFSLVAVDPPGGAFPDLLDYNHLLFNSGAGFDRATEFTDYRGFWYAGTSGDIDRDGDLDIVMFNFHVGTNGVQSRILWNDGHGDFTSDTSGIGSIPIVDQAELFDVNGDGFLDLVIDRIETVPARKPIVMVLWGNGIDFQPARATQFDLPGNAFLMDIAFADLDDDGTAEIILASVDDTGHYGLRLFRSDDGGDTFEDDTAARFDNSQAHGRFDHILLQDIDGNGRLDLYAPDRFDNIRWEWDGAKFARFEARGELRIVGSPVQGATLEAVRSITDDSVGPITYDWQFSPDGQTWTSGGAGPTHMLTAAEAGLYMRVIASFEGTTGVAESLMSGNTGPVGAVLQGGAGADVLVSRSGNDRMDGAAGIDVAVFGGPAAAYTIEPGAEVQSRVVTDALRTRDGIDTLIGVERLQFEDGALAFDIDGHAGEVARILGAVFGPAAQDDAALAGLGLFVLDAGFAFADVVAAAVATPLFAQLAGGRTHAQFVDHVYSNVTGELPNAGERDYFVGLLEAGTFTQASLALIACNLDLTAERVDLTGLAETGLAYLPYGA